MLNDKKNILLLRVNSMENQNIPPFGYVVDYITFGGVYRDVYIDVKEKRYISNVFASTRLGKTFFEDHNRCCEKSKVQTEINIFNRRDNMSIRQSIRAKDKEDNEFVLIGKDRLEDLKCKKESVSSDMQKAYIISEYMGHMYPTKNYDPEEHRVEHAIRHANVLNEVNKNKDISGSFGWCMFDYNTHKDLSSTMDIGEHPECNRGETYIFTNADSVKMYKNNNFIKEYTHDNTSYRFLNNLPIIIDDYIGDQLEKNENMTHQQYIDLKQ